MKRRPVVVEIQLERQDLQETPQTGLVAWIGWRLVARSFCYAIFCYRHFGYRIFLAGFFAFPHLPDRDIEGDEKSQRGKKHDGRPMQVAEHALAGDLLINVKTDRLVLGFLHRMPQPQRRERRIGFAEERLLVSQKRVGEDGGEMLQRAGPGELGAFRAETVDRSNEFRGEFFYSMAIRNGVRKRKVAADVLLGVHGLLVDEALDLLLENRIGDPVAIVLDRLDEEFLAGRKDERDGVEKILDLLLGKVPTARLGRVERNID